MVPPYLLKTFQNLAKSKYLLYANSKRSLDADGPGHMAGKFINDGAISGRTVNARFDSTYGTFICKVTGREYKPVIATRDIPSDSEIVSDYGKCVVWTTPAAIWNCDSDTEYDDSKEDQDGEDADNADNEDSDNSDYEDGVDDSPTDDDGDRDSDSDYVEDDYFGIYTRNLDPPMSTTTTQCTCLTGHLSTCQEPTRPWMIFMIRTIPITIHSKSPLLTLPRTTMTVAMYQLRKIETVNEAMMVPKVKTIPAMISLRIVMNIRCGPPRQTI